MPPRKAECQNIRVAVRCRPLNKKECNEGELNVVESCRDQKITLKDKSSSSRSYTFDRVFGPQSKQRDVYNEMVAPTVVEVIEGYNCTIFAYGQTGTGKTFTMTGERSDALRYTWETDPMTGIVPRALNQIFSTLETMGCDFSVRVSFMELYNEELFDLLSSGDENIRLAVYDDSNKKGSVVVKGLREVAVHNKEEVYSIIEKGLERRQTASTLMNAQSSRSHTVFTVTVHIKELNPEDDEVFLKIGKLNLVDLAGSENIGRSGAQDKRAREAGSINQSLLTLGRVITCLVDHAPHIPYRESKLTRLLQDSLGGRTKTSIIATISPGSASLEETVSTLDYAHRAKNIQNRPQINQKLNKNQLIKGYNEELERLRKDLEAARSKTGIFIDADNYQTMQIQLKQQRSRIDDLEGRKEVLESDLESAIKSFELTQQELTELREAKERVEDVLEKTTTFLQQTTLRLQETERRLEEESYLRSQHQSTEEKLSDQAQELLSAATVYQGDTGELHDKLDRVASLDFDNRATIESLHSVWLPEMLQEPLEKLGSFKGDMSAQIQKLTNELVTLRKRMDMAGEQNLREVSQLSSALSGMVAANLEKVVSSVDLLTQDHVRAVGGFRDSTMAPALAALTKADVELQERLVLIQQRLSAEASVQKEMFNQLITRVEGLSNSAEAWARLRELELEENARLVSELESRRKIENTETYALVNSLQEAMSRISILTETRVESDKIFSEGLSAKNTRLVALATTEETALKQVIAELSGSISSVGETRAAAVESITADCRVVTSSLRTLGDGVQRVGVAFDDLVDKVVVAASDCMSSGVGSQILAHSNDWRQVATTGASVDDPDATSVNYFKHVTQSFLSRLELTKTQTAEEINRLGESVEAVRNHIPTLDAVSSTLVPRLPSLLGSHLAHSVKAYAPTGKTPQRRRVAYPSELVRTRRHSGLLSEFRRNKGFPAEESPLADLTNADVLSTRQTSSSSMGPPPQPPVLSNLSSGCVQGEDEENSYESQSEGRTSSGVGTSSPTSNRVTRKLDRRSPESAAQAGGPSPKRRPMILSEPKTPVQLVRKRNGAKK